MRTSPLSPQDIRAAAEVYHELGPEYSDAVVANFVDKLEDVIAERVSARLAAMAPQPVAVPPRRHRGRLAAAVGGACAAVLIVGGAGLVVTTGNHAEPAVPASKVGRAQQVPQVPHAPSVARVPHPSRGFHALIKRSAKGQG
jgi:hypothetical protein